MSNVHEDREYYLRIPGYHKLKGDFTPFYVAIGICTVIGLSIIILNIVLACSRYRHYWCDSNTGNRWILPIWTKTPEKQTPLDLTELDERWIPAPVIVDYPDNYSDYEVSIGLSNNPQEEFVELVSKQLMKKESDI